MKRASIFWFTGLSGAGKTTIALGVRKALQQVGLSVAIFDGDDIRSRLHRDLGFSPEDIRLNNKLIAELCATEREYYDVILVPIISPFDDSRRAARKLLAPDFYEIHCDARLDVVVSRDTKGLYDRAYSGALDNMIGVSPDTPYEKPLNPDLRIDTSAMPVQGAVDLMRHFVSSKTKLEDNEKV
ncbi:MAG: adenylyl-sulfate kinase [Rhodospirillaceae bacterium]|mgnify:CR=1 FL=1|nr:adenylyl-sulfate kinase [Rhodospirillaceae bacterium]|tara:strand:+ start:21347 stop:21898 length:552 start_codon:yes stop_codon:yes gene_type:complete